MEAVSYKEDVKSVVLCLAVVIHTNGKDIAYENGSSQSSIDVRIVFQFILSEYPPLFGPCLTDITLIHKSKKKKKEYLFFNHSLLENLL